MEKHKLLLQSSVICLGIILSITLANVTGGFWFYIFYNLVYGLLLSTILPLWLTYKESETYESLGIKKIGLKQIAVILGFVAFSIGGQLSQLQLSSINFGLLSLGFVPLVMTTFFEEFLFRGYIQTRLERQYGWIPAVLLSGFFFSIYHLGYPGFRTAADLLLLFAVGIGFSLAFKLSGGNVIVSYFVNLPNAFLTYILKSRQFPTLNHISQIVACITIAIIIIVMVFGRRKIIERIAQ
jgi:membrane protease YdiL (CAAX protease family)